jgi:broad specificity phosphatase PhoE
LEHPLTQRILLVRHGESTANVAAAEAERAGLEAIDVEARDADVRLSALGREQAATLGDALREKLGADWQRTARVWSSPYRRARETARIATGAAEATEATAATAATAVTAPAGILIDERLRDRELGIIDALTSSGVDARLPSEAARRRWLGKFYYRPPGGESWADVALRVRSFLRDAETHGGPTVVFTHDAVVSLFVYVLLRFDEAELTRFLAERVVANASITSFRADAGGGWSLESFADATHVVASGVPATEHTGTDADGS